MMKPCQRRFDEGRTTEIRMMKAIQDKKNYERRTKDELQM